MLSSVPARLAIATFALALGLSAQARDLMVSGRAAVRERADVAAPVVTVVADGAIVFVHATAGPWLQVSTRDGQSGWMAGVVEANGVIARDVATLSGAPGTHLLLGEDVVLHGSPAAGSRVVGRVEKGTAVRVTERFGAWVRVVTP